MSGSIGKGRPLDNPDLGYFWKAKAPTLKIAGEAGSNPAGRIKGYSVVSAES